MIKTTTTYVLLLITTTFFPNLAHAYITNITPDYNIVYQLERCTTDTSIICLPNVVIYKKTYAVPKFRCSVPGASVCGPIFGGSSPGKSILSQTPYETLVSEVHAGMVATSINNPYVASGGAQMTNYSCAPDTIKGATCQLSWLGPNPTAGQPPITSVSTVSSVVRSQPYSCNLGTYIHGQGCASTQSVREPVTSPSSCESCSPGDSAIAISAANQKIGNPVDPGTGAKIENKTDILYPIPFTRAYLSTREETSTLGSKWKHSFERNFSLYFEDVSITHALGLTFKLENNEEIYFTRYTNTEPFLPAFADHKGYSVTVVSTTSYILHAPNGSKEYYEVSPITGLGRLSKIEKENGFTLFMGYNSNNQLVSVTDSYGKWLNFVYSDYANILTQITASNGDYVQYTYLNGLLSEVKFNNIENIGYTYDPNGNLLSKTDAKGNIFAEYTYDTQHRVLTSKHLNAPSSFVDNYQYNYTSSSSLQVIKPNASTETYSITTKNSKKKVSNTNRSSGLATTAGTFDANGNPLTFNDGMYAASYTHDLSSNLLSSSTYKGVTRNYNWNNTTRKLNNYTETTNAFVRTYSFLYDSFGNNTQKQVTVGGETRTWGQTFGSYGKPLVTTTPSGVSNTITYYSDTDANVHLRGLPYTISNGQGHTTTINSYNSQAKPTSMTLPDGRIKTMTYDFRGRVLTETLGGITNSYVYDANGQLTQSTLANGYILNLNYDMTHRLIGMSDNRGNSLTYTLDTSGNITNESEYAGSTLIAAQNKVFDNLSRVIQTSGPSNSYPYNYTYNKLNMVRTIVDPNNATQTLVYDSQGNVDSASSPGRTQQTTRDGDGNITTLSQNGHQTTFGYNGFGEMIRVTDPNVGFGDATYSQNLTNKTRTVVDNSSVSTTTTYDNIGRPTMIATDFVTPETFVWDTIKTGKLTSASVENLNTSYNYDANSRLISKTQDMTNFTTSQPLQYSVLYNYDSIGQVNKITYPSGLEINYSYDKGVVNEVKIGSNILLNQINYRGFSKNPVSWSWGNSATRALTVDANGRLTGLADSTVMNKTFTLNNLGKITASTDSANTNNSFTATYSTSNQLTSFNTTASNQLFTQDSKFNLTSIQPVSSTVSSLSMGLSGQRLSTLTFNGTSSMYASYDQRGNLYSDGINTSFSYNHKSNLVAVVGPAYNSTYTYNYRNERTSKLLYQPSTSTSSMTHFVYDEAGRLIGEYDGAGVAIMEHIYFGGVPVAVVKSGVVYYVHTDHLGTPRAITNAAGSLMWKWDNTKAYGNNLADDMVSGTKFEYNLRFPGQYFDKESGLHYNKNRIYHPMLGRYLQTDPLKTDGGMNSFAYTENDPVNASDSEGLVADITMQDGVVRIKMHSYISGNQYDKVNDKEWLKDLNKQINDTWNSGNWMYGKCKVVFDINFTTEYNDKNQLKNTATIYGKPKVQPAFFNYTDPENYRSHVMTDYSTGVFYSQAQQVDYVINAPVKFNPVNEDMGKLLSHEVAHMMGVKDKYITKPSGISVPHTDKNWGILREVGEPVTRQVVEDIMNSSYNNFTAGCGC